MIDALLTVTKGISWVIGAFLVFAVFPIAFFFVAAWFLTALSHLFQKGIVRYGGAFLRAIIAVVCVFALLALGFMMIKWTGFGLPNSDTIILG